LVICVHRHILDERKAGNDCIVASSSSTQKADEEILKGVDALYDIVKNIRDIKNKNGISRAESLEFFALKNKNTEKLANSQGWKSVVSKLALVSDLVLVDDTYSEGVSFISGTDKFFILLNKEIDVEAEIAKLEEELKYQEGFVQSVSKKLENENFVGKAPEAVVENERKKKADGLERIKQIKDSIANLKK